MKTPPALRARAAGLSFLSGLSLGLLLSLSPRVGSAQLQIPASSPLQSVVQPGQGIADSGEPWSVVLNPASLASLRGWMFGLRHSELTLDTGFSGRGTGLYLARPLPYLSKLAAGGALEILRPPQSGPQTVGGKLSLALAYRPRPWLSLGVGYAHWFAPSWAAPSGSDTVQLGAHLTISRFAAIGLVASDLSAPLISNGQPGAAALTLERSYELETLFRPLGDSRFELATGLRVGESSRTLWPRARLWARPTAGLGLSLEGSVVLDPSQLGGSPPAPASPGLAGLLDYRIALGLSIDFARVGADLYGLIAGTAPVGSRSGVGPTLGMHGVSVGLRVSTEHYPTIYSGAARMVRVDLGGRGAESTIWLLTRLRKLERDSRTQAVVIIPGDLRGTWATADELRQAVLRLRAAGKHVFSYSGSLSSREYYVASAAERIFLDPEGGLRLTGLHAETFYFRDALDRLGIRADLVRIGDYKSAPESYTRSEPTEPARRMRQGLIDEQFERLVTAVSSARLLERAQVQALVESGPLTAERALTAKLVDAVATGEQTEIQIRKLLGTALPLVPLASVIEHPTSYAPPGIAIVHVHGDMTGGVSREVPYVGLRTVGAETIVAALEAASVDPQVRAIVLRINSAGGSATAADVIARQIVEVQKRKPVVCSLADIAASGGYYAAAPCSVIFALPSTITGSIGIFGGKVDASGLLDFLRVRRQSFQRGSHSDAESPFRPYSDAERENLREQLQQGYERFLATVAAGRHMTRAEVHERAQGRVLSGEQALALRLIDRQGGLSEAISEARRRAGLAPDEPGPLFYYPQRDRSLLSEVLTVLPNFLQASAPDPGASLTRPALASGRSDGGIDPATLLAHIAAPLLPALRSAILLFDHALQARIDPESGIDQGLDLDPVGRR